MNTIIYLIIIFMGFSYLYTDLSQSTNKLIGIQIVFNLISIIGSLCDIKFANIMMMYYTVMIISIGVLYCNHTNQTVRTFIYNTVFFQIIVFLIYWLLYTSLA